MEFIHLKYYNDKISECDKRLCEGIEKRFNSPNLKYYLTEVDLGNDFDNNIFQPLTDLYYVSNDPNYSFIDEELDLIMKELLNSINTFLSYKSINTFPTQIGTQALRTWKNYQYTQDESMKIIGEFNDLATDIWDKYCCLVKAFKKM